MQWQMVLLSSQPSYLVKILMLLPKNFTILLRVLAESMKASFLAVLNPTNLYNSHESF
jgi:hypothetical protein